MTLHPLDHRMWAVIGVYGGREDNTFYRRGEGGLERHGIKVQEEQETVALGESVIHSVTNPLLSITAAIHVYPGDLFETPRSEWDPETFEEHPYDVEHTLQVFEASNRRISE
jgi:predicted metal-dependent enzyme (double-stranded beta helix superfamily)